VGEVRFSQDNIAKTFRDGRSLAQLIKDLHAKKVHPMQDDFLVLNARSSNKIIYCCDNRRLYCLQEYQKDMQKRKPGFQVMIRVRILLDNDPTVEMFIRKHTTDNDGRTIVVRNRQSPQRRFAGKAFGGKRRGGVARGGVARGSVANRKKKALRFDAGRERREASPSLGEGGRDWHEGSAEDDSDDIPFAALEERDEGENRFVSDEEEDGAFAAGSYGRSAKAPGQDMQRRVKGLQEHVGQLKELLFKREDGAAGNQGRSAKVPVQAERRPPPGASASKPAADNPEEEPDDGPGWGGWGGSA